MYRRQDYSRPARYAACTAIAAVLLAGFAGSGQLAMASASGMSSKQERKLEKAVSKAERRVEKAPQSIETRVALANSYINAGRFESAVDAFQDAQYLGDKSVRTALSLALAHVATGEDYEAVAILDQWRDSIPASDLGLALALAGESNRGVAVLSDALRGGDDTAKLRQNLAYAYALDGRWREARLMAAQDVPADKLDARISEWAKTGRDDDYRKRVSAMLRVPVRSDVGQPQHLALVDRQAQSPAALAAANPMRSPVGELPAVEGDNDFWVTEAAQPEAPVAQVVSRAVEPAEAVQPAPANAAPESNEAVAADFARAFAPTGTVSAPAHKPVVSFVSNPVVQSVPVRAKAAAATPARASRKVSGVHGLVESSAKPKGKPLSHSAGAISRPKDPAKCTHLVQLGSFSKASNADRAWKIFVARNPELKNFDKTITKAIVRGKTYWRVSAAGFDKRAAKSMCSSVKGRGGGCIAYSQSRPLPGAVPGSRRSGAALARR